MPVLIIMNGFTATGKSFVAQKLADSVPNTKVFHTAAIRKELNLQPDPANESLGEYKFHLADKVFIDLVSPLVYGKMLERAEYELSNNNNSILDGSFSFLKQRLPVYEFALSKSIPYCILQVVCENKDEIRKRLNERKISENDTFDEADGWNSYKSTIELAESVEEDILPDGGRPPILKYDSFNGNVDASLLSELLKSNGVVGQIIAILKNLN